MLSDIPGGLQSLRANQSEERARFRSNGLMKQMRSPSLAAGGAFTMFGANRGEDPLPQQQHPAH